MTNRIIFLDFDGVLNDPRFLSSTPQHTSIDSLDPKRTALLKKLCSLTNSKVVLTSSWRDDLKARKYLIQKWGIPIIGATPHKHGNRGLEIKQWMIDKKFTGQWIIIDDECSDLSTAQREHLILTREYTDGIPILGLHDKHIKWAESMFIKEFPKYANSDFIRAILLAISEELDRVYWDVYQKEYDDTPFQNTGNIEGFKTDIFEVHAYDWGWDSDDCKLPEPVNFKWRDLEINWYKWYGRGLHTNRPVTHDELAQMLTECLESLLEWEAEHEKNLME